MAARHRAAFAAAGLLAAGAPAQAAVDEVVVTSRIREEALQTVPIAVTAFTSEQIERVGIRDLQDISQFTPGLTFQNINGTLQLPVIRGLAQTNISGAENNVANFINGIYLSNNRTLDLSLVDIERVEVIKGPQSALYGRNSFAGAISYVTAKPTDEFEAYAQGTVGGDELYDAKLSVSGPLIGDKLAGRAAVMLSSFDGTFENEASSDNLQGWDNWGAFGALAWQVTENLTADAFAYYADQKNDHFAQVFIPNNCGQSAFGTPTYLCGTVPVPKTFSISPDAYGLEADNTILGLTLTWQINDRWTLTSLTGWADSNSNSLLDNDGSGIGVPYALVGGGTIISNGYLGQGRTEVTDFSEELRLSFKGDRWSGSVGGYYYDSDRSDQSFGGVDSSVLAPGQAFAGLAGIFATPDPVNQPVDSNSNKEGVETLSFFAEVSLQATDKLELSLEGRYQDEEKSIERILLFAAPPPPTIPRRQDETFKFFTYRAIGKYQFTDDVMYYLSVATGARSGGFNARSTLASEATFDEETNTTYELGTKTQWFDRRLTANAALFYVDWNDLQIASRSQDPANIFAVTLNTGNATSLGLELELIGQVTDGLSIGVGYAYADAEFDGGSVDLGLVQLCGVPAASFCRFNDAGLPDVSGNQLGRTHKNQFTANVQYTGAVGKGWDWYARADFAWLDEQPVRSDNAQFIDSYSTPMRASA